MHPQAGLPLLPPLTIAYWNQRPNVTWDKTALFLPHLHVWYERTSDKSGKIRLLTPESRWLYKVPK